MVIGPPHKHTYRLRIKMLTLDILGRDGRQFELQVLHIFVNLKSFHEF